MVKVYVNGKNMGAESVQFSQLMFDQYNVCEYNDSNDSNVIILLRSFLYDSSIGALQKTGERKDTSM